MSLFAFVGPALKLLSGGINHLADKSDESPKTSAALATLLAAFGVDPNLLATVGGFMVKVGSMLGGIAT